MGKKFGTMKLLTFILYVRDLIFWNWGTALLYMLNYIEIELTLISLKVKYNFWIKYEFKFSIINSYYYTSFGKKQQLDVQVIKILMFFN